MARHGVRPFVDSSWHAGPFDLSVPLENGWMGVDLFFVLSGFLITSHLLTGRTTGRVQSVWDYLRRRAWRILPAYYVTVLVILAGLVPFYRPATTRPLRSALTHLFFLQDLRHNDLLPAFWSLGVEEKFYLVAPLVVLACWRLSPRRRLMAIAGLAVVPWVARVVILWRFGPAASYEEWFGRFRSPAPLTFDGLAAGMLLAAAWADGGARAWLLRWRRAIGVCGWTALALLLVSHPWLRAPGIGDHVALQAAVAWSAAAVVAAALAGGPGATALAKPALFPVAVLSYSAYLVHELIIPMAMRLNPLGSAASGVTRFAGFVLPYLAITAAGTALLHFGVERPALSRRDVRTRSTTGSTAAPVSMAPAGPLTDNSAPQLRSVPPVADATAAMTAERAVATSSSFSVRSTDCSRTE